MKNIYFQLALASLFIGGNAFSQAIGVPPGNGTNARADAAWYRGGNVAANPPVSYNIFGFVAGSNALPIITQTNGVTRTRLNGTLTTPINGVNKNVDGFFGISPSGYFANNSPAAMLHLYGPDNSTFGIGGGWRSWMNTGMLVNENSDAMYVGMKPEPGTNRSDAVIAWNDDAFASQPNTDKLRFIFTGSNTNGNGTGNNPINPASLEGYEYMRMTSASNQNNSLGAPVGYIGIGPVFNNAAPPQNRVHINAEEALPVFVQISNQNSTQGTGQTVNDGLHVGYAPTNIFNLQAQVIQKENDRLTFYTNNGERMKIMHTGALNNNVNINPGNLANNITRIAVSHNPTNPITRPLSLMHLGYNTQGATDDGWRPWMDVGTYMSNQSDNVYLGLKQEPALFGDRQDAVLSWGDNQINSNLPPGNGPDNFRIIFTSTLAPTAGGTSPATSADGLEALRMTPTQNTGIFTGIGGDYQANMYGPAQNSPNPTNTVEINSWGAFTDPGGSSGLRFTDLNSNSPTITNPGIGVLSVDNNGDVILVPGTGVGNYCGLTSTPLPFHYEIPQQDWNYYFTGQGKAKTNVAIGVPCATPLLYPKLLVYQATKNDQFNPGTSIAGQFANVASGVFAAGVYSTATGTANTNIAGYFEANTGNSFNYGIYCTAPVVAAVPPSLAPNNLALFADGDVFVSGTAFLANPAIVSDQQFKTNLDSIQSAIEIVKQLKPRTYEYTNDAHFNFPAGRSYGFIAQDVEQIVPELVKETSAPATFDTLGNQVLAPLPYKTLNYQGIIPILAKAIQEQQAQITSKDSIINNLNDRLTTLENCINALNLCGNNHQQTINGNNNSYNITNVDLKDAQSIVLEQNVPNPFAEQTTINYFLPDDVKKAQLIFYNAQGKLIQSLELSQKGKGSVNVFANDLSNGIYTYTLVVDGKIIETKKMLKQ